ncbi:uncharacterized protein LOC122063289 isoform X4 [Macadamia integrifolia]|uniref:uncharacterized protein LOC122063289 isoform X4 n=1 Tax=Macadamia integrifolia TaxID=60698 RepID=UPI001C4E69C7|nr:uncharacterized protein LOC122063289 isoform X4 [Macadamia integrifolia]
MHREISSRVPSEQCCVNVSTPKLRRSSSTAQKMDDKEELHPISESTSIDSKKESSRNSSCHSGKWIHVIPVIVFICWFILWWFSHPDVEKKDGRIVAVHRFMALPMDNTRDNLPTMLPPTSSNGLAPQELNNGTEPQQSVNVADKDGSIVSVHRFMAPPMENTTQDNLATMFPPTPSDGFAPQELNNGSELRKIM